MNERVRPIGGVPKRHPSDLARRSLPSSCPKPQTVCFEVYITVSHLPTQSTLVLPGRWATISLSLSCPTQSFYEKTPRNLTAAVSRRCAQGTTPQPHCVKTLDALSHDFPNRLGLCWRPNPQGGTDPIPGAWSWKVIEIDEPMLHFFISHHHFSRARSRAVSRWKFGGIRSGTTNKCLIKQTRDSSLSPISALFPAGGL